MSLMTASDLFAQSQGSMNTWQDIVEAQTTRYEYEPGKFKTKPAVIRTLQYYCHWCGSKAGKDYKHDDSSPRLFIKNTSRAKNPSSPWVCHGCTLWRRPRVTIKYLDEQIQDSQCAQKHSWWITDEQALAFRPKVGNQEGTGLLLYKLLLVPPRRFVLSLLDDPKETNHLHLAECNDLVEVREETPLKFTINNVAMTYTVYDLEHVIDKRVHVNDITDPGVRALVKFCGVYPAALPPEKRGRGRPPADQKMGVLETLKRVIQVSGITSGGVIPANYDVTKNKH